MHCAHTLSTLIVLAALEGAPKPVVEWLEASKMGAHSVKDLVADARIVIVGRAFNGVTELAEFESSVVEHTNPSGGDVIALDVGPREGEAIDQWLRTVKKPGLFGSISGRKIKEILAASGAVGWSRVETSDWLRTLALRVTRPRITGIATGDPKLTTTEVLAYLAKVAPDVHPRAERVLRSLASDARNGEPGYSQLDENGRAMLRIGIEETLGLVRDGAEAYTNKSSAAEYARALRLVVELKQYEEQMRFEREAGDHDPRGRIMAENALAALEGSAKDARLFALVGMRDLGRASEADSFAAQLVRPDGPRVVCIGTVCGAATFSAIDPNVSGVRTPRALMITSENAGDLENAVAAVGGVGRCIFDLRQTPSDEGVRIWLRAHRSLRSAGPICGAASETPWDHDVLSDFDALAWFPRGTASALDR